MKLKTIEIKHKKKQSDTLKDHFLFYANKFLFVVLLTLVTLILAKTNTGFKSKLYKEVYERHINFSYLHNLYNKYLGPIMPFKKNTLVVFSDKIKYSAKEKYLDGVALTVTDNYSVSALDEGMVVFIGEKEGYGKTVIIETSNGVEMWYANINSNLKIYDYVEKGALIGEANQKLYMVFKKDNQVLNYEEYI